jgi:hypothetical protein
MPAGSWEISNLGWSAWGDFTFIYPPNTRKIYAAGMDFSPRARKTAQHNYRGAASSWEIGIDLIVAGSGQESCWSQGGLNMVSKWSQFEIEQKTINLAQSKKCAKLMNNKEKVLGRSGSYGWT